MKAKLIIDVPVTDQKRIWIKKICKPYFDHPFHYHPLCELTWLEKGSGKLIIGDYVGIFSEGELILESAGLPHLWRCDPVFDKNNNEQLTKSIAVYFSSSLIPKMIDDTASISLYNNVLYKAERGMRFHGQTKKNIIELIKKIAVTEDFEQLGYFLQIIAIITRTAEFDYLASVSYKNTFDDEDMASLNEVYQFLLQNFTRDISLNEVAAICNMTPNSFCRFFKIKTHKTFTRLLNELRIGHACKLLQHEDISIKNISYECGYNSPTNFFNFFKIVTNKTPQEYRNHIKQMNNQNYSCINSGECLV